MVSAGRAVWLRSSLVLSLVSGLLVGLPPVPVAAESAVPAGDRSVPVSELSPSGMERGQVMPVDEPRSVVWPSVGSAVVGLPVVGDRGLRASGSVVVGGLPVRVSPVLGAGGDFLSQFRRPGVVAPGRVRVEVLDRAVASRVGAAVAVRVSRADGVAGAARVRVEVDYSAFRHAYGADWAWRLGLVAVPSCALAEPVALDCAGVERLDATNDAKAGLVSAEVELSSSDAPAAVPVIVGLMASGSSSESGDFTRTDLKESSSWAAGGQSGDFAYSYPLSLPPVPGGLVPQVVLSYSSGAVDGQTAGGNTQPGAFGEGWSYSPGFIERTYRPCNDDTAHSPYWTQLNSTADLCWRLPNASIVLNGKSSQIVLGDDGVWRLEDDDGEKVELLTGAPNLDSGGEHWKITTRDGTQYWFGRQVLPNGRGNTNSTAYVNVFANHSGEPCFSSSSVTSSRCYQAWRWGLDYVVDPDGNEISYWYSLPHNRSALLGSSSMNHPGFDAHLLDWEGGIHAEQVRRGDQDQGDASGT